MIRWRKGASKGFLLLAVWAVTGCATGSSTGAGNAPNPSLLTAEEIGTAGSDDAFSVVQALRPRWLWTRGATSINQPESIKVYLDGSLMGGPEYLRQIRVRSILSIRFLDALEATNRWGLDHGLGAIMVSTRREKS